MSSDDHVKIGDFGLATKSMTRALTSSAPGVPNTNLNHLNPSEAFKENGSLIFRYDGWQRRRRSVKMIKYGEGIGGGRERRLGRRKKCRRGRRESEEEDESKGR